jgi:hypothetical protein
MIKKIIGWFWGNQKDNFKPRVVFNAYCYFRADCYIADLITQEPSEYINGDTTSQLMRLAHKNEPNLLMYAKLLNLKGSMMSWFFSWWWVVYDDEYYELLKGASNEI